MGIFIVHYLLYHITHDFMQIYILMKITEG